MRLAGAVILGRVPEDTLQVDADFVAFHRTTFRRIHAFVRARVADAETAQELTSRVHLKAYRLRTCVVNTSWPSPRSATIVW